MVPFPARRVDDPDPDQPGAPYHRHLQPEIEDLTNRLAAQGIQSTELVLDLVLHDLADEARQAVAASGAAIALERDGELVCRAAAGSTAPDLGVRINTESGLSGICVKEGATQICSNTEIDPRVDAEACRRLGVRSIAVVPLFSPDAVIGILETFSAHPDAFSPEDIQKLESLASVAAQTVKGTREKALPAIPVTAPAAEEIAADASRELSVASIMQKVAPRDPAVRVLRWLLIGLAIPLVILIGFDWGWHRGRVAKREVNSSSIETPMPSEAQSESLPPLPTPSAPSPAPPKSNITKPKAAEDLVSRGGLIVYQNGKVIYRETPRVGGKQVPARANAVLPNPAAAPSPATGVDASSQRDNPTDKSGETSTSSLPAGITGGQLLQSVRPKYPPEAILQKVEGAVVLHGTVGEDGTIRDLKLVRGDTILARAALEAVQQWKYEPYHRNGAAISMPIDITIDFNLPK